MDDKVINGIEAKWAALVLLFINDNIFQNYF